MHEYRDLSRLTLVATTMVWIYLALDVTSSIATLVDPVTGDEGLSDPTLLLSLLALAAFITCTCVVGRWIYRASENAHAMTEQMSISPGWAVGWYFVPFANLIKPFHAMREIWFASNPSTGGFEERAPAVLGWWWALWLATNVIGNMAFRVEGTGAESGLVLVGVALDIPLCIVLVTIMRQISSSQRDTLQANVFA